METPNRAGALRVQPIKLFHHLGGRTGNLRAGRSWEGAAWRTGVRTRNARVRGGWASARKVTQRSFSPWSRYRQNLGFLCPLKSNIKLRRQNWEEIERWLSSSASGRKTQWAHAPRSVPRLPWGIWRIIQRRAHNQRQAIRDKAVSTLYSSSSCIVSNTVW